MPDSQSPVRQLLDAIGDAVAHPLSSSSKPLPPYEFAGWLSRVTSRTSLEAAA